MTKCKKILMLLLAAMMLLLMPSGVLAADSFCGDDAFWRVENGTLTNGFPIGVSNEFVGMPATISVENGTLLVMWQAEKGNCPRLWRCCEKNGGRLPPLRLGKGI